MSSRRARVALLTSAIVWAIGASACNGDIRIGGNEPPATTAPDAATGCTEAACAAGSLHCDPSSAKCVVCTMDAHCDHDGLHRCDTAEHRCVECGVTEDCGSPALSCEPATRKCVATCGNSSACPTSAPTCDLARGLCVACTVDASCAGTDDRHHCENASGRCVECIQDDQCSGERPRCDRTTGACVVA